MHGLAWRGSITVSTRAGTQATMSAKARAHRHCSRLSVNFPAGRAVTAPTLNTFIAKAMWELEEDMESVEGKEKEVVGRTGASQDNGDRRSLPAELVGTSKKGSHDEILSSEVPARTAKEAKKASNNGFCITSCRTLNHSVLP